MFYEEVRRNISIIYKKSLQLQQLEKLRKMIQVNLMLEKQ